MVKLKKLGKGKDSRRSELEPEPAVEEEDLRDLKHICVTLCGYKNIVPTFSITDLTVQAIHADIHMGESTKTTATDDILYSTNFEFVLECDINSTENIDKIISHPVTFKVFEYPSDPDPEIMAQVPKSLKPMLQEKVIKSAESAAELHDLIADKPFDKSALVKRKNSLDRKKSSVVLKKNKKDVREKSKQSVSSSKSAKTKTTETQLPIKEAVLLGTANLDLLPLFTGNKCFTESLLIYKTEKYYDDQLVPVNIMPRLLVEVSVKEDTWLPTEATNVISLTIESIYHIPEVLSSDKFYSVSTYLPSAEGEFGHAIVTGGKWTESLNVSKMKCWPRTSVSHTHIDDHVNQDTKYRIDDFVDSVHNKLDVDLEVITNSKLPRIEFNTIKRNYLSKEANRELHKQFKKYRRIPFEIYVSDGFSQNASSVQKVNYVVFIKEEKPSKLEDVHGSLHLMAEVNVAVLLYPGVTKLRIVCPLNTFHEKEIQRTTGLVDSAFVSKPIVIKPSTDAKKKTDKREKKEKYKQSEKSLSDDSPGTKISKKHTGRKDKSQKSNQIPVIEEEEESSIPIYCDNNRTFVLLEIELLVPLEEKRTIEDLTQNLLELIPPRPKLGKHIVSEHLSEKYFSAALRKLLEDLMQQHDSYLSNLVTCPCTEFGEVDLPKSFLTFLRKGGIYETYVTSMTRAITTIINEKKPYVGDTSSNSKEYQDFISNMYTDLVKHTNSLVNELCNTGVEIKSTVKLLPDSELLFLYAKEACELRAILLADRYYLERICQSNCPDNYWFDYAIFQLELGEKDKAFECVRESLLINDKHKYSLMLIGILLHEKGRHQEAETCFLSAMLLNPKWLEGWGTMHVFYASIGNEEGADLCLEMANKSLRTYKRNNDYFSLVDDLAWSIEYCPQTVFFKTGVFLIKMRTLQYAEKALALTQKSDSGMYHYYLSVIMYYRHQFNHSLLHLEEAEKLHGLDYAIGALKGHCFLALENLTYAKEEYIRVLEMFNRPTDMHLVYIYLALIFERLDDRHQSRKLLLLVCKHSPTPYTWLAAALIYYAQRDLISAEQCLLQANLCDNRLAEVWGYLVIINLELGNFYEAEMCYKQTKKNKIENTELLNKIEEAWKCVKTQDDGE
ncbi:hypothetical protein FQR65_LT13097 [Abscondita terminalis]|nr:hypothetical protein FQR65_LT13097 [Abscondita terminalis]